MTFVVKQRCNGLLRRPPLPAPGRPIEHSEKVPPTWHWVGGSLSVDTEHLFFEGVQRYGDRRVYNEPRHYKVPLERIAGMSVKRGPLIARYVEVKITNGGRLHLRPSNFGHTVQKMEEAVAWASRKPGGSAHS